MIKKKGFTLIELLAVIVILAIIALIAVPMVLTIINDSKKSSEKESIKLYTDMVEKALIKKQLQDSNFKASECSIIEKGNLNCEGTLVEIEMKGQVPERGTILINGSNITFKNIELNGKKYFTSLKLLEDNGDGKISIGDKYEYEVAPNIKYTFYILSMEGNKVNLIMNQNICENGTVDYAHNAGSLYCRFAWNSTRNDNGGGPVTAMQKLYNATKNWSNVPDMDLSESKAYVDEGYLKDNNNGYSKLETTTEGIVITDKNGVKVNLDNQTTTIPYDEGKPLKARLPREDEIISDKIGCHLYSTDDDYGTCPLWIIENLYYSTSDFSEWCPTCLTKYEKNNIQSSVEVYAYWLMPSTPQDSRQARFVDYSGCMYNISVNLGHYVGIRPVITVLLSDLE